MTNLMYGSVTPATLAFSQLIAKKNSDRMYPIRDVPKANLAAPMMFSFSLFISKPPENIPSATAGILITPKIKRISNMLDTFSLQ